MAGSSHPARGTLLFALAGESVADLLRGDYNQSEFGHVILLFTVRRRSSRCKNVAPR